MGHCTYHGVSDQNQSLKKLFFILANSAYPDEIPLSARHFYWVLTLCQNTLLGVYSIQGLMTFTLLKVR